MASVVLQIAVLVWLAALAPKFADAHGYMMVRAHVVNHSTMHVQVPLYQNRALLPAMSLCRAAPLGPFKNTSLFTGCMTVLQKPISRSWLAAGQRFANYYSPDGFYGPMNLNRSEINNMFTVLCLHQ